MLGPSNLNRSEKVGLDTAAQVRLIPLMYGRLVRIAVAHAKCSE